MTQNDSGNNCLKIGGNWWERSVNPNYSTHFRCVGSYGGYDDDYAANTSYVFPAWCF